jgi:hypothetical protein
MLQDMAQAMAREAHTGSGSAFPLGARDGAGQGSGAVVVRVSNLAWP